MTPFAAYVAFAVVVWIFGTVIWAVISPLFQHRPKPVQLALPAADYDIRTYDEVARTLRPEVRETIESHHRQGATR